MRTLVNSEDPDEMPHDAAFHQGLYYLLRQTMFRERNKVFIWKLYIKPVTP